MSDQWQINLNVTGKAAATGGTQVVEGYYEGVVSGTEMRQSNAGNPRVLIKVKIPEFGDAIRTTGINVPRNADDPQVYYWRAALESMGYTAEQLDQGEFTLTPALLLNRPCTFYFKPGDRDAGVYETFSFLPRTVWAERKARFQAESGGQAATTTTTTTSNPLQGGGNPLGNAGGGMGGGNPGTTRASLLQAIGQG